MIALHVHVANLETGGRREILHQPRRADEQRHGGEAREAPTRRNPAAAAARAAWRRESRAAPPEIPRARPGAAQPAESPSSASARAGAGAGAGAWKAAF